MHRILMIALLALATAAGCDDAARVDTSAETFDSAALAPLTDRTLTFDATWTVSGQAETGSGIVDLARSEQSFSVDGPGLIQHRFVDGIGYLSSDGRCPPPASWVQVPEPETPSMGVVGLAPGVWFDAILWNRLLEFAHIEAAPNDSGAHAVEIDLEEVPASAGLATTLATLEAWAGPEITGEMLMSRSPESFTLSLHLEDAEGSSTTVLVFSPTAEKVPQAPAASEICS
jgi:hypothetical protein